jgi:hypothetical protein
MANYGTKYVTEFYDWYKRKKRLELKFRDYEGAEHRIPGAMDPVILNDPNQGAEKDKPIHGTEMEMSLLPDFASAEYDFDNDFRDITDRQCQAILKEVTDTDIYKGTIGINTLNIQDLSTPPEVEIQITHVGAIAAYPTGRFYLYFTPPIGGFETLYLWMAPDGQDKNGPDAVLLSTYNAQEDETYEEAMDNWIAADDRITGTSTDFVWRFEYRDFDVLVDSSWSLFVTVSDPENMYINSNEPGTWGFTSAYTPQKMSVKWYQPYETNLERFDDPITLAEHTFSLGETLNDVALDLATQLNNTAVPGAFIYDSDFPNLAASIPQLIFKAEVINTDTIRLYIKASPEYEDSYQLISITNNLIWLGRPDVYPPKTRIYVDTYNTDYATYLPQGNFSPANFLGDSFDVYIDTLPTEQGGQVIISEVTAYDGDTLDEILARTIAYINDNTPGFTAALNPTDSTQVDIFTENEESAGWTYRFVTSGPSDLYPEGVDNAYFTLTPTDKIEWIGWVLPNLYERKHVYGRHAVVLRAVDGLADLKNIEFEFNNARLFAVRSIIDIARIALQKTGLNLGIYTSFDYHPLHEANTQDGEVYYTSISNDERPLEHILQKASRLNGRDCYTALKEVAQLLFAQLRQINGHWEFIPLRKVGTSYTAQVYDSIGLFREEKTIPDRIYDVGGDTEANIMIKQSFSKSYAAAARKVKTMQDYGFNPQLLEFPSFISIEEHFSNLEYPWKWGVDDRIETAFADLIEKKEDHIIINEKSAEQPADFYLFQRCKIALLQGDKRDTADYEFTLGYISQQDNDFAADEIQVELYMKAGGEEIWGDPDAKVSTDLASDAVDISEGTFSAQKKIITIDAKKNNGTGTLTLKFNYPTLFTWSIAGADFGIFEVRIYQPTDGAIYIQKAELKVNTQATTQETVFSYYQEKVDEMSAQIKEREYTLGDVIVAPLAEQIFKGALYRDDPDNGEIKLVKYWSKTPATPNVRVRMVDLIRSNVLAMYAKQVAMLSGELRGPMPWWGLIRDKTDNNIVYMPMGVTYHVRMCEHSGEWLAINIDNSGLTQINDRQITKQNSGGNTYNSAPSNGVGDGGDVDLSSYATKSELTNAIKGKEGQFTGDDLINQQITIYHGLGRETPIIYLYRVISSTKYEMIDFSNYMIDTEQSTDHVLLTISIPVIASQIVKYRIL